MGEEQASDNWIMSYPPSDKSSTKAFPPIFFSDVCQFCGIGDRVCVRLLHITMATSIYATRDRLSNPVPLGHMVPVLVTWSLYLGHMHKV